MADFTSELCSTEIRHAIDETKLQLGHLWRSQEDLEEFLKESQDSDFKLAFEENKCVLVHKRQRLRQLINLLVEVDPSAYAERKSELDGLTIQLKLDDLTPDAVQLANDTLSRMSLGNDSPIEIVRGGVRQRSEEQAILGGSASKDDKDDKEQPSSDGLYL